KTLPFAKLLTNETSLQELNKAEELTRTKTENVKRKKKLSPRSGKKQKQNVEKRKEKKKPGKKSSNGDINITNVMVIETCISDDRQSAIIPSRN
ncbi:12918_t:CDS:1, partial [Cetraspora pellucida]